MLSKFNFQNSKTISLQNNSEVQFKPTMRAIYLGDRLNNAIEETQCLATCKFRSMFVKIQHKAKFFKISDPFNRFLFKIQMFNVIKMEDPFEDCTNPTAWDMA